MRSTLILLLFIATIPCFGQWIKNPSLNTPIVTTSTSDNSPVTVPDGAGGSIVLFNKAGVGTGNDIYAQKVNTDGTIAWGNTGTPVLVCNAASEQVDIQAIPDGSGGAFLTWVDWRFSANGEIYCQHINSAGTSLWTANGVQLTATVSTEDKYPYLCSDDAGGIIVTWTWNNKVNDIQTSAQRIKQRRRAFMDG
jgi:accessory colonization factor AcfC